MELTIRIATPADAEKIVAIYEYYVKETPITFEYEVPSVAEFSQRIATTLERYPYLVAEIDGEIIGYAYAGVYKGRVAYDWTVEVTVYVSHKTNVKGVGTALYEGLETYLLQQHVVNLTACITGGNQRSVGFHEKFGYQEVANFHHVGYKFDQWHDVLWMQKVLTEVPTVPAPFVPFAEVVKK
ncbi:GNAT family N-acetyltransferase [Enterococcus sp. HY326]|uniref:GNAT family N-acetyltransferase n=1 Tax=Enterococcus sp. HY326 TaxID=2971265 RepID=UPI002240695C|nr:GNAT family N-acetyltransferase [Enterococcus sp. HY326]